jgi:hypothetical protein
LFDRVATPATKVISKAAHLEAQRRTANVAPEAFIELKQQEE